MPWALAINVKIKKQNVKVTKAFIDAILSILWKTCEGILTLYNVGMIISIRPMIRGWFLKPQAISGIMQSIGEIFLGSLFVGPIFSHNFEVESTILGFLQLYYLGRLAYY
ncbi:MAG: hypothetical protein AAB629_01405 [Patescibacteria group bacterium]